MKGGGANGAMNHVGFTVFLVDWEYWCEKFVGRG